MTNSCQISGN